MYTFPDHRHNVSACIGRPSATIHKIFLKIKANKNIINNINNKTIIYYSILIRDDQDSINRAHSTNNDVMVFFKLITAAIVKLGTGYLTINLRSLGFNSK